MPAGAAAPAGAKKHTMITDKIKWDRKYEPTSADAFGEAQIYVADTTPEIVWRNLTNMSDWTRFDKRIVDINFEDSADNDPHLFDKAQFYYDTNSGKRIRCTVIDFVHPKDDRSGRLAYQGSAFDENGNALFTMVAEFLVGVPDKKGEFQLAAGVTIKGKVADGQYAGLDSELMAALGELASRSKQAELRHEKTK